MNMILDTSLIERLANDYKGEIPVSVAERMLNDTLHYAIKHTNHWVHPEYAKVLPGFVQRVFGDEGTTKVLETLDALQTVMVADGEPFQWGRFSELYESFGDQKRSEKVKREGKLIELRQKKDYLSDLIPAFKQSPETFGENFERSDPT